MYRQNINPYIKDKDIDKSPLLLRSAIAYIDVLGYTELIETAHKSNISQYTLKFSHNAFKWAHEKLEQFSEVANANDTNCHDLKNKYMVKGFSDNIVIGYPIENPNSTS